MYNWEKNEAIITQAIYDLQKTRPAKLQSLQVQLSKTREKKEEERKQLTMIVLMPSNNHQLFH